ncbi:hypothetical protein DSO57_1036802 [Entomophthora muscae]|uniref:Uncharacterized protein n=1 Tax=Entomophthora muscae TaxID=34485 RepID=A0ACC2RQ80_9FUNG|nr:hypothetical protein DSO57_1036802 [Entomophthora muscae]
MGLGAEECDVIAKVDCEELYEACTWLKLGRISNGKPIRSSTQVDTVPGKPTAVSDMIGCGGRGNPGVNRGIEPLKWE